MLVEKISILIKKISFLFISLLTIFSRKNAIAYTEKNLDTFDLVNREGLNLKIPRFIPIEVLDKKGFLIDAGTIDVNNAIREYIKKHKIIKFENNEGLIKEIHSEVKKIDLSDFNSISVDIISRPPSDMPKNRE
jgi:hypothetical protein